MSYDGTLKFDTEISTKELEKAVKRMDKILKFDELADSIKQVAENVGEISISVKTMQKMMGSAITGLSSALENVAGSANTADTAIAGVTLALTGLSVFAPNIGSTITKTLAPLGPIIAGAAKTAATGIKTALSSAASGIASVAKAAPLATGLIGAAAAAIVGLGIAAVEKDKETAEQAKAINDVYLKERLDALKKEREAAGETIEVTDNFGKKLAELDGKRAQTELVLETYGAEYELEGLREAISNVVLNGNDAAGSIDTMSDAIMGWAEAQKSARMQQFAEEMVLVAEAYNKGEYGAVGSKEAIDKLETSYNGIIESAETYSKGMERVETSLKAVADGLTKRLILIAKNTWILGLLQKSRTQYCRIRATSPDIFF